MDSAEIREVYLHPGDFCFGEGKLRIATVLGSCVSITLWHPLLLHGGMCHYMLPTRHAPYTKPSGKYGDEAMELFMRELQKYRTHPSQYQVRLYGGGNMFDVSSNKMDIGRLNVEMAFDLLNRNGFTLLESHVGMSGHRRLTFDVWSGEVKLVHNENNKIGENPCKKSR
ncbi:MAG: chemotaxis protein CheD [Methylophilaceae bacterium]|nr:chemotaxis protein CheD [Methylophilaceae bacterium]